MHAEWCTWVSTCGQGLGVKDNEVRDAITVGLRWGFRGLRSWSKERNYERQTGPCKGSGVQAGSSVSRETSWSGVVHT
jgi:hypothetical protein